MVSKGGEILGILILRAGFRVLEYFCVLIAALTAFFILMQDTANVIASIGDIQKFGWVFLFLIFAAAFEFFIKVFDLKIDEVKKLLGTDNIRIKRRGKKQKFTFKR